MKKLILLAAILITLISCDSRIEKVDNPKAETTVEIQSIPADTMLVAIDKKTLYAINKETNLVEYKAYGLDGRIFLAGIVCGVAITLLILLFVMDR